MTSPRDDSACDGGPILARLIGTWSYPRVGEQTGIDYLHFHESGIAVQVAQLADQLDKPVQVRMKYSLESDSRIRVSNIKGEQTGWTVEYRLKSDALTIINRNGTYVCTRVSPEKIPEWFREAMEKYL